MVHVVSSSTALAMVTNASDKHKSTSPSAIQVKNQQKANSIEEKLDFIRWLIKDEWIVDMFCNVRFTHSNICTIHDKANRIKESAKSGTKVFV